MHEFLCLLGSSLVVVLLIMRNVINPPTNLHLFQVPLTLIPVTDRPAVILFFSIEYKV